MVFYLVGFVVCFIRYFEVVYGGQFFDCFYEFEFVVVYQEVDSIVVCFVVEVVVKLFFIVDGERGGFFVMEWIVCVKIFVLFFQFYLCIDQIDDVGFGKQIVNKYMWNLFSYKFCYF